MINEKLIILVLVIGGFSLEAQALIQFEDAVFPEFASSARAQAMGNAYIGKVDDATAAFYNPAGLGTVRGFRFAISAFHLEASKDLMKASGSGTITELGTNATRGFNTDGTRELLLENRGTIAHSRFHIVPNITFRYFSAGFLYSKRSRSTIGLDDDAQYEFSERTDMGPYAALNLSLFGGIFKFGATGIILNRKEIKDERDRDTKVELKDNDFKKGTAAMITIGGRITLPMAMLPTFAAVIHNAADQTFSASGAGAPDKKHQTLDLGFSLTPQIGKTTRVHLEVNYKDFMHQYKETARTKKLGVGLEFDFARVAFARIGYGDGWGSAGIGVKGRSFEFNLTTYAIDTSTSVLRGEEDRRFAIELSQGF